MHYEKMHEMTEYTIQYHFTPEIFVKRQSIKKALQEALDKKSSKRHPSVSDLEQKGSPSLPPVEVIMLEEDASSQQQRQGSASRAMSSFDDVEPSTSTALALNRCDQVINDEQMKKVQDTVEQFCAQTLRLKDDSVNNDECFSMSLNDLMSSDRSMSNNANIFGSGGINFGMSIPKQSRLKQSVFQKGVSYKCLKCNACVTGPCIIMHINMRHLKFPCFRCRACDKKSLHTSSTSMVQHIRQAHNGDMNLIENNYKEVSREVRKARPLFFEIYRV
uniref:C2H2-type domain-containing protein n=1 Tax=Ditylenchus dipsaci TaxID=166011 RepID=A0A915CQ57_9BILA